MNKIFSFFLIFFYLLFNACDKKKERLPVVTTSAVTPSFLSAQASGVLYLEGDEKVIEKGICWGDNEQISTTSNKVISTQNDKNFSVEITGLKANTNYYFKAYAINKYGISYGKAVKFNTKSSLLPSITLDEANNIQVNSADLGANLSGQYEQLNSLGICLNTQPNPTIGNNTYTVSSNATSFMVPLLNLLPNTIYYARAFAINNTGIVYSNQVSFKTYYGSMTDLDGNIYYTVKIGQQVWMASNLRVTQYSDGSLMPNVPADNLWDTRTTGAYCFYNNDQNNDSKFGKLYNWLAIQDMRGLAPSGWHIPSESEWNTLINFLSNNNPFQTSILAQKLTNDNIVSFKAPLGGYRMYGGSFYMENITAFYWSSTPHSQIIGDAKAFVIEPSASFNHVRISWFDKKFGCSIRCIKD